MALQPIPTYSPQLNALAAALQDEFCGKDGCALIQTDNELTLVIPPEKLLSCATRLRDLPQFSFEQLLDLCGVDYAAWGLAEWETTSATAEGFGRGVDRDLSLDIESKERFAVVSHLLSIQHNFRLRLRCMLPAQDPIIDSLVSIWPSANWFEREAFDMYGILFRHHPDLRRILTDYGFVGYPLRKDFPTEGEVEMRYDPERRRVVYEPVSITPRTLVAKVIRYPAPVPTGPDSMQSPNAVSHEDANHA